MADDKDKPGNKLLKKEPKKVQDSEVSAPEIKVEATEIFGEILDQVVTKDKNMDITNGDGDEATVVDTVVQPNEFSDSAGTVANGLKPNGSSHSPVDNLVDGWFHQVSHEVNRMNSYDFQPVQVINNNVEVIMDTMEEEMFIGNQFIDAQHLAVDGSFVLVSNMIHPAQTNGFITMYSELDDIPANMRRFYCPGYGLANAMAVKEANSTRIIVGFDSGHVLVLNNRLSVKAKKQFCHNIVTGVKLNCEHDRLVCTDFDGRIVVVDTEEFSAISYYDYAHVGAINDFSFHPNEYGLIVTAGTDGDIILWDLNMAKTQRPASILHTTGDYGLPTALNWLTDQHIYYGTEAGLLMMFDIRQPEKALHVVDNLVENDRRGQQRQPAAVTQIRTLNDGRVVSVLAGKVQCLFNAKMTRMVRQFVHPQQVNSTTAINNGRDLLTIGQDMYFSVERDIFSSLLS